MSRGPSLRLLKFNPEPRALNYPILRPPPTWKINYEALDCKQRVFVLVTHGLSEVSNVDSLQVKEVIKTALDDDWETWRRNEKPVYLMMSVDSTTAWMITRNTMPLLEVMFNNFENLNNTQRDSLFSQIEVLMDVYHCAHDHVLESNVRNSNHTWETVYASLQDMKRDLTLWLREEAANAVSMEDDESNANDDENTNQSGNNVRRNLSGEPNNHQNTETTQPLPICTTIQSGYNVMSNSSDEPNRNQNILNNQQSFSSSFPAINDEFVRTTPTTIFSPSHLMTSAPSEVIWQNLYANRNNLMNLNVPPSSYGISAAQSIAHTNTLNMSTPIMTTGLPSQFSYPQHAAGNMFYNPWQAFQFQGMSDPSVVPQQIIITSPLTQGMSMPQISRPHQPMTPVFNPNIPPPPTHLSSNYVTISQQQCPQQSSSNFTRTSQSNALNRPAGPSGIENRSGNNRAHPNQFAGDGNFHARAPYVGISNENERYRPTAAPQASENPQFPKPPENSNQRSSASNYQTRIPPTNPTEATGIPRKNFHNEQAPQSSAGGYTSAKQAETPLIAPNQNYLETNTFSLTDILTSLMEVQNSNQRNAINPTFLPKMNDWNPKFTGKDDCSLSQVIMQWERLAFNCNMSHSALLSQIHLLLKDEALKWHNSIGVDIMEWNEYKRRIINRFQAPDKIMMTFMSAANVQKENERFDVYFGKLKMQMKQSAGEISDKNLITRLSTGLRDTRCRDVVYRNTKTDMQVDWDEISREVNRIETENEWLKAQNKPKSDIPETKNSSWLNRAYPPQRHWFNPNPSNRFPYLKLPTTPRTQSNDKSVENDTNNQHKSLVDDKKPANETPQAGVPPENPSWTRNLSTPRPQYSAWRDRNSSSSQFGKTFRRNNENKVGMLYNDNVCYNDENFIEPPQELLEDIETLRISMLSDFENRGWSQDTLDNHIRHNHCTNCDGNGHILPCCPLLIEENRFRLQCLQCNTLGVSSEDCQNCSKN